jgi:DNA-binding NarL/FixJ family response regulator
MSQAVPINVAIVEDDPRVREGLAKLIQRADGFALVGVYGDGETALAQIPQRKPDVVLMDIKLPGMSGIECVRGLKAAFPSVQIIMLTVYDEVGQLFNSLMAGACGYLLKRTPSDKLLEAITEARMGGAPMTRTIARKVVQYFQQAGAARTEASVLSKREQETLALLAEGFRYKEIADKMGITFNTVRVYVHGIYQKLHVTSRTEALNKLPHHAASPPSLPPAQQGWMTGNG